jgi:trypsin/repeat uncharacterized protein DUF346
LIAAVAMIVIAVPGGALGAEVEGPATGSPAIEASAPQEVAAYQKEFGVSAPVAKERLEIQHRGAGVVPTLEGAEEGAYAGVWFDNARGEFVVPMSDPADRGRVGEALASIGLEGSYRTAPATYSWDELEATQHEVNAEVRPLAKQLLVQTSIDPRTNAVVLTEAQATTGTQEEQLEDLEEDDAVEVRDAGLSRFESEVPAACNEPVRACGKPLRGGVQIVPTGGGYCSAGFKAVGKTSGARYLLTAGHCAALLSTGDWYARNGNVEKWERIGSVENYAYPGHDWAKINANGSFWDTNPWPSQVAIWGGELERPINYEASSYVGEAICHVGAHVGFSCGTVTAIDQTVTYVGGATIEHMTRAEGPNLCTLGGDSGGPVIAGNTALGLLSGGPVSETCPNGSALYQEITEATDWLGAYVAPRIPRWHPADNIGGTFTSDLAASSWGPGRLDVFGRGVEGALWHKAWVNGFGWFPWESLGGSIQGQPAAVSWGSGRIDVVARMSDDSVGHWYWAGSGWGYDNLGGVVTSSPALSTWGPNRLDVFARGSTGEMAHKAWDNGWFPWENLGGGQTVGDPSAVSWSAGRLDAVSRMANNTVGHWYWAPGWGYDNLGGVVTDSPVISTWGPGRLDVFARGSTNEMAHMAWDNGWFPWENLGGGPMQGDPSAVSWSSGRIDVVARMSNNNLGHWFWVPGWGFDNLGGSLSSSPAIVAWSANRLDVFGGGAGAEAVHWWWE